MSGDPPRSRGRNANPDYRRRHPKRPVQALGMGAVKADIRTVVDTARLAGGGPFGTILKTVGA